MFKKAERKQVKLKIALTGPSGSGKTFSALILAHSMGKKIALIDTEKESASLYANRSEEPIFDFDTAPMSPPYAISKYTKAINAAVAAGYEVLIIDTISHAWMELLNKKEALDSSGRGNGYTNWGPIGKEHEAFKSALLNSDIHIIATMRSKQDYVLVENEKGKQTPKKVGLAPIQRDGIEFEFTTVLDIAMDHSAAASKDRTGLFDGLIEPITSATGKRFMDWLAAGKAKVVPEDIKASPPQPIKVEVKPLVPELTSLQIDQEEICQMLAKSGMNDFEILNVLFQITGKRKDSWTPADVAKAKDGLVKLGYTFKEAVVEDTFENFPDEAVQVETK